LSRGGAYAFRKAGTLRSPLGRERSLHSPFPGITGSKFHFPFTAPPSAAYTSLRFTGVARSEAPPRDPALFAPPKRVTNTARSRSQNSATLRWLGEQMVTEILPVGVGALSWITLQLEIRGWERFQNRRQVASYTGLCPGIHNSNGRGREGRINRCGNTIVRYTLIEMVWRLIRWQPDYPPIKKLRNALLSKRGKRRLIVAAAVNQIATASFKMVKETAAQYRKRSLRG